MKKYFWLGLVLAAVLGFSASQVFARGGGHGGGGHGGGGHHGGHHGGNHAGHHNGNHYHHAHWAHNNRPFSHGWYGHRGGAWGYGWGGWGWGNPWAVSTLGAAGAWLGLDNAATYNAYEGEPQTVYTSDSDTAPEIAGTLDDFDPTASDAPQADAQAVDNQDADPAQSAAAAALAKSGESDPPKDTSFLPLGVFTLAPANQAEATALVQLAISKNGMVRGTYYDLLSDHDHPLRGALDKKSKRVAFTFGPQGKVVFDTSLANLTQEKGDVAVYYENGKSGTWTLARYTKEPSESKAEEDAADEAQDDAEEDTADPKEAQENDAPQGPELPANSAPAADESAPKTQS